MSTTRHLQLVAPPPSPAPWWHLRPTEKRPLAWIVGAGGPVGFLAGALLGIFLQVPGPALPETGDPAAGQGMPVTTSVAPPEPRSAPAPAQPSTTGSDAATRRAAKRDATRPAVAAPTRRARTAQATRTTVTVTSTPPSTPPTSTTPGDEEGSAPEGGESLGADPS